jgi:hypothetical protein
LGTKSGASLWRHRGLRIIHGRRDSGEWIPSQHKFPHPHWMVPTKCGNSLHPWSMVSLHGGV